MNGAPLQYPYMVGWDVHAAAAGAAVCVVCVRACMCACASVCECLRVCMCALLCAWVHVCMHA